MRFVLLLCLAPLVFASAGGSSGGVCAAQAVATPLDASRVVLSKPALVASFSSDEIKGFPVRLSWSPDGRQLHLRAVQRDVWANEKEWHFVVRVADGKLSPADGEPPWSSAYWFLKSSLACPGLPGFRIDVESRTQQVAATNAGAGGSIAQNAGDPYGAGSDLGPQGQAALSHAQQSQNVTTTTLRVRGQVVSEFVNAQALPGLFFSWAPEGLGAIAYSGTRRNLVVMDQKGRRYEMSDARKVILPAWSPDGARLAWIEQRGRGRYALRLSSVSIR
jgi:hypothetical protein